MDPGELLMSEHEATLLQVDWSRMAEPQADGYDTDLALQLATSAGSRLRPLPYRRRPVDGCVTICDGAVAVRVAPERGLGGEHMVPAKPDHPNLAAAASFLARWPDAYVQFARLIDTIYPYSDIRQARMGAQAFGSSSHSYEHDFGSIIVTIDDPIGSAQGMIHEMAHQKLRALGVSFESADRLITNPETERFISPIRKDRTRPMTAVFHAQYSFIHVTALDLCMLAGAHDEMERTRILMFLARNVPRMQAGQEEIISNIKTDDAGSQFLSGFLRWSTEVLAEGQAKLDANGYGVS
jgi:HEXXH motif-containing protein